MRLSDTYLGCWCGNLLSKLGDSGALDQLYAALPSTRGRLARIEASLRTDPGRDWQWPGLGFP